jgi:AraC-like DNA-binding protein
MLRRKHDKPRGILKSKPAKLDIGYWRYWPSEDMAPFIEHYWTVEWDLREPQTRETLPHPSVQLILEAGVAQVAGVHTGKFTRVLKGKGRVLGVKFRPGGFRPFITQPVSDLTDRVLKLSALFGRSAAGLGKSALAHRDHQAAIREVESFLRGRLPEPDASATLAGRIAESIIADRSITKVEQLAQAFDINARRLQRLFSDYVGVYPKWVIQRYRLHEAAERMASASPVAWTDISLDLGYADQAHFIRDFKKIVGCSPAAYMKRFEG